ncbi:MAG: hypothetical protein R2795_22730 [Saprospiraceae bacterium]
MEIGVNAHLMENKKLTWDVRANISFNRNEITSLGLPPSQFGTENLVAFLGGQVSGGNQFKVPANIFIEGRPAALFWGYQTNGIISNADDLAAAPTYQNTTVQLGDVYYVDQNGDGNINEADLTILGDPNPKFNFGFGTDLAYNRFSMSMFFNGIYDFDLANGNLSREAFAAGNTSENVRSEAYFNAWSENNPSGTYPRIGYINPGDFTDRMVEDGSFLRLSFVSLGYSLPAGVINGVESIKFYVSGQNLWLLTNYSGFDPEVDSFSFDPTRRGIDFNAFPNQRTFTFGLNAAF